MLEQFRGIAVGRDGVGPRIEKDAVVADREDAGQLVGHDHDCRAEAVAQLQDEIVEQPWS